MKLGIQINYSHSILSSNVSIRREQEKKIKKHNHSEMNAERVETSNRQFTQSANAPQDKYMIDILSKVRQSSVTCIYNNQ